MSSISSEVSVTTVPDIENYSLLSKFYRALGDPNRLRLLEFILVQERCVTDCVDHLDLSQGRVSIHLACLADCGFIESRRSGRFNYYSVNDPRVADLVMLGRSLSVANCEPIESCARIDDSSDTGCMT